MNSRDQHGRKWHEAGDDDTCPGSTGVEIASSQPLIRSADSPSQAAAVVAMNSDTASSELSGVRVSSGLPHLSDQNIVHSSSSRAISQNDARCDVEEVMRDLPIDIASKTNHDIFCHTSTSDESPVDDWEAMADSGSIELLPSSCGGTVAGASAGDAAVETRAWRGRGTSLYQKDELYSDRFSEMHIGSGVEAEDLRQAKPKSNQLLNAKCATRHVLVMEDIPTATTTIELENLFRDLKGRELAIRWINNKIAIVVFQNPQTACEAHSMVRCPFRMRILGEDDILLGLISERDLEPPCKKPQTSATTAKRMIAHGMGVRLPSTSFDAKESMAIEETRKNRIIFRHKMRDDAWGC